MFGYFSTISWLLGLVYGMIINMETLALQKALLNLFFLKWQVGIKGLPKHWLIDIFIHPANTYLAFIVYQAPL